MIKPIILIGAGGHARVLIDALKILKRKIAGATDINPNKIDSKRLGCQVLGTDDIIFRYSPNKIELVNGVGSIQVDPLRATLFKKFKDRGYTFANIVHPYSYVSSTVILGEGVQILAGAIVQTGSVILTNSIINTNSSVDHDCRIGEHSHISPAVTLCGDVEIGAGSHVGVGAIVVNGVVLKPGSFIKAGSLVTKKFTYGLSSRNKDLIK